MRRFYTLLFFLSTHVIIAQQFDSVANKYSLEIKSEQIKEYLYEIASDEYEGRETGKKGQKMAMNYLINNFKSFGIEDYKNLGYKQSFELIEQKSEGVSIIFNSKEYSLNKNFSVSPSILPDTQLYSKLVFIASGKEEIYKELGVIPNAVFISVDDTSNNWNLRKAIGLAKDKGVNAIFYRDKNFEENAVKYAHYFNKARMTLSSNVVYKPLTYRVGKEFYLNYLEAINYSEKKLLKKGGKKGIGKETDVEISIKKPSEKLTSENVIAFIPGNDKKEELIVITAHYDHIGMEDSLIYNGADDDGTGTVSLIEIAESFMKAKKDGFDLKRSILIMPVSGEEKGLLGSKYYTDNPIFPLENTIANLNIDMIGRYDKNHKEDSNYVYLIGSDRLSNDLHNISEEVNSTYFNINLDYTFNKKDDPNRFYYRSDHYNFAKNNIPVIFYFSGVHKDYHKATDTVEKIDYDKTTRIARLVFMTAWELANREERIKLNE